MVLKLASNSLIIKKCRWWSVCIRTTPFGLGPTSRGPPLSRVPLHHAQDVPSGIPPTHRYSSDHSFQFSRQKWNRSLSPLRRRPGELPVRQAAGRVRGGRRRRDAGGLVAGDPAGGARARPLPRLQRHRGLHRGHRHQRRLRRLVRVRHGRQRRTKSGEKGHNRAVLQD